jgi:hypothetical protein
LITVPYHKKLFFQKVSPTKIVGSAGRTYKAKGACSYPLCFLAEVYTPCVFQTLGVQLKRLGEISQHF